MTTTTDAPVTPTADAQALCRQLDRAAAVTPALIDWWLAHRGNDAVAATTPPALAEILDAFASVTDYSVICPDGEVRHTEPYPTRDEAVHHARHCWCGAGTHGLDRRAAGVSLVVEAI
jgi:hypothetical protein